MQAARARQPDLLVMALPSAEPATAARLRTIADALVCGMLVSSHPTLPRGPYELLPPVTDEEVEEAMRTVMA